MLIKRRRTNGFTLIEIITMIAIFVMISGVLYKLLSGTWSNYYKSQTKLTNLRAASILLEYLKHDIRLATVPTGDAASKPELPKPNADLDLKFQITDGHQKKRVHYSYNSATGYVERTEDGQATKNIGSVKVKEMKMDIDGPAGNKYLKVHILVDADKDEKNRAATSVGNQVAIKAILFPRFLKNFTDLEEKFWNNARSVQ